MFKNVIEKTGNKLTNYARRGEMVENRISEETFEKRPYILDNLAEALVYDTLYWIFKVNKLNIHIFPQVHLSSLIKPKKDLPKEDQRSLYFEAAKLSVDFVLVSGNTVNGDYLKTLCIIELDGESHKNSWKQKKDKSRNYKLNGFEIPILRITDDELQPYLDKVKNNARNNKGKESVDIFPFQSKEDKEAKMQLQNKLFDKLKAKISQSDFDKLKAKSN